MTGKNVSAVAVGSMITVVLLEDKGKERAA